MSESTADLESATEPSVWLSSFGIIYASLKERLSFESPCLDPNNPDLMGALIPAAFAKCYEFNLSITHGTNAGHWPTFLAATTLRGICEDLVVLSFLSKYPSGPVNDLLTKWQLAELWAGTRAQRKFFELNNPFRPVVAGSMSEQESEEEVNRAKSELNNSWRNLGFYKKSSLKEMALAVNLPSTYDYIYFLSSNFVHFNPQALLKLGWGDRNGPYRFSLRNIDGYFGALASFYGSVLFVGFASRFSARFPRAALKKSVDDLLNLISRVERWPEIITFEEMNQRPPFYLLTHATRIVAMKDGEQVPYGEILNEVRSLAPTVEPEATS